LEPTDVTFYTDIMRLHMRPQTQERIVIPLTLTLEPDFGHDVAFFIRKNSKNDEIEMLIYDSTNNEGVIQLLETFLATLQTEFFNRGVIIAYKVPRLPHQCRRRVQHEFSTNCVQWALFMSIVFCFNDEALDDIDAVTEIISANNDEYMLHFQLFSFFNMYLFYYEDLGRRLINDIPDTDYDMSRRDMIEYLNHTNECIMNKDALSCEGKDCVWCESKKRCAKRIEVGPLGCQQSFSFEYAFEKLVGLRHYVYDKHLIVKMLEFRSDVSDDGAPNKRQRLERDVSEDEAKSEAPNKRQRRE